MELEHVIDASTVAWKDPARKLLKQRVQFRITNPSAGDLDEFVKISLEFNYHLMQERHMQEFLFIPKQMI